MTTQDRHTAPPAGSGAPRCVPQGLPPAGPPLPDPAGWALFLDLDGTLLDIAAAPDAVSVAPGLAETLEGLERMTAGALALVTGRTVGFVDGLFPGTCFTIAGLHGAELRPAPPLAGMIPIPPVDHGTDAAFRAAREAAHDAAQLLPGVLFEDKGRAFALHYRQAPDQHSAVARVMAAARHRAGPGHVLRAGKCVVELCPSGRDKGTAVRNLMAARPFKDRYPVAAGDDLTDEAMFRAVNAMGGLSIRVGAGAALARSAAATGIATPRAFRAWLGGLIG